MTATKKKKIDHNSSENQRIKGKFVEREVKACFSYEMEAVLKQGDNGGNSDLPSTDQIENLYEYRCPECGHGDTDNGYFDREDCPGDKEEYKCPQCDHEFSEAPESEPQDILEWWIVSKFLYDKLKAKGCPVLEWGNNYYWGRCCSGQAILLDDVISEICAEMEILDGQKYSWAEKGK